MFEFFWDEFYSGTNFHRAKILLHMFEYPQTLNINPYKLFTNGLRLLHNEEKSSFTSATVCHPKTIEEDIENKKWRFQLTLAKVSFV